MVFSSISAIHPHRKLEESGGTIDQTANRNRKGVVIAMRRACTSKDLSKVINYVSGEPEVNLYILGDIETYGVDAPVTVDAFEKAGIWTSLVLGLAENYVVYSQGRFEDAQEAADLIGHYAQGGGPRHINARLDIAEALAPHFPEMTLESCKLATCRGLKLSPSEVDSDLTIRQLHRDDYEELLTLQDQAHEMPSLPKTRKELDAAIERKTEAEKTGCETIGVYRGGRLVSSASTSAAYSRGAMVTGVATLPSERGRGYATLAVQSLCQDCFARGMDHLCLYYNNPVAARIYKRIGFVDIADFGMLRRS